MSYTLRRRHDSTGNTTWKLEGPEGCEEVAKGSSMKDEHGEVLDNLCVKEVLALGEA